MQNRSGHADMENQDAQVYSSETIGAYLRDERISRDIALEEVSESTGISKAILRALENEDREKLPSEVYIKAFYKKYAQFLGLDPDKILSKYYLQARSDKRGGSKYRFSTVITLKGQEENLFVEILRKLFLPIAILAIGVLLYWIYNNYLASYNPLGFYQEHFPSVCSLLLSNSSDFFC